MIGANIKFRTFVGIDNAFVGIDITFVTFLVLIDCDDSNDEIFVMMMSMITIMTMTMMMIVMETMSAPVKKTPGAALYTRAASPGFHNLQKVQNL